MTKQKWIIAPVTGEILPRVRNLKMKSATADSPIYSRGFVIGGIIRFDNSKPTSPKDTVSNKTAKPTKKSPKPSH